MSIPTFQDFIRMTDDEAEALLNEVCARAQDRTDKVAAADMIRLMEYVDREAISRFWL